MGRLLESPALFPHEQLIVKCPDQSAPEEGEGIFLWLELPKPFLEEQ
jgi:hypothetical protein